MKNTIIFLVLFTTLSPAQDLIPIAATEGPSLEHRLDLDHMARTGLDGIEVVGGYGEGTDNFRFAAGWVFYERQLGQGRWTVNGTLTANLSNFEGESELTSERVELRDVGLTPVWRFFSNRYTGFFQPYLELAIGLHHLSSKDLPAKHFSTHFQFGDHIGLGMRFGYQQRFRATYQFQHLSNGGIDAPNPGINFHLVSMGYRFKTR